MGADVYLRASIHPDKEKFLDLPLKLNEDSSILSKNSCACTLTTMNMRVDSSQRNVTNQNAGNIARAEKTFVLRVVLQNCYLWSVHGWYEIILLWIGAVDPTNTINFISFIYLSIPELC